MKQHGILIAAPSSGSGKTVTACGLMAGFTQLNMRVHAAKCGPDYIDPMFHREVLGLESENLDLFFSSKDELRNLYLKHAEGADITVVEGVMGYYDGMKLGSVEGSAYEVADALGLPVILVVPCRGMSTSILALLKGMLEYQKESHIRGIILNKISAGLYPRMKEMIETGLEEMGHPEVKVLGFLPQNEVFALESRHLGLVTPMEMDAIKEQMSEAGKLLQETVDLEGVLQIAKETVTEKTVSEEERISEEKTISEKNALMNPPVRIAVARDEAFCFYYKENLELLRSLGAELVEFSPLRDSKLPEGTRGILLGGGYPELYAEALSENVSLLQELKDNIRQGVPTLAECGGFLYLQESMAGEDGRQYQMVGAITGSSENKGRLVRFGYVDIQSKEDTTYLKAGEVIKAHEFHHWDSTNNGCDFLAVKPDGKRSWECIHAKRNLMAGFPHLYYPSNPEMVQRFIEACS